MKTRFIDTGRIPSGGVRKTPEGYLRGSARVTRSGIFSYKISDGQTIREINVLRHPDEVFSPKSMATLKGIPITNTHPNDLVDANNLKQFIVGFTGDTVAQEDIYISSSLTIADAVAVGTVLGGRQELSCCYDALFIPENGVYQGKPYSYKQADIVYNHVALEDVGRAGPEVRLEVFDGATIIQTNLPKEPLMKITLFGTSYDVADDLGTQITKLLTDYNTLQGQYTQKTAAHDAMNAELLGLKKVDTQKLITEAATARLELYGKVRPIMDSATLIADIIADPLKVVTAACKKLAPSIVLDGKDAGYITALFDVLVSKFDTSGKGTVADGTSNTNTQDALTVARQKYIERLTGKTTNK